MNSIVRKCVECPFFGVDGMEHMMYCNHPTWKADSNAYAGAIITQDNKNGIPAKCPLRKGPFTETRFVRLGLSVKGVT